MGYNVTAVEQNDPTLDNGPAYLLSGLSNTGYWYQAGLSWNWSPGQIPGIGFNMNYEVFAPSGSSIFPTSGGAGLMSFSGPINQGDRVLVRLYFANSNVIMAADDENTGSSASEVFSAGGGTYFVGLTGATANAHGFFTGLMTEWYHGTPFYGQEQKVVYSNSRVGLSSALMWVDEYNTMTNQTLFASTSSPISYSGTSTLQSFASHNATVYSNAHEFITGSLNIALTLNYSVYKGGTGYSAPILTYLSAGTQRTAQLNTYSATYFIDNGTHWSVSEPLPGSSSTQRWATGQPANGTANLSETVDFVYYRQFNVTFEYQVSGGASGYKAPTFSYDQFGSPRTTATGIDVWVDFGSFYNDTDPLVGSTSSEAWFSGGGGDIVQAPHGVVLVTYYISYRVVVNISLIGAYTYIPSGYMIRFTDPDGGTSLGTLGFRGGSPFWQEANSTYSFAQSQDSSERWIITSSNVPLNGTITGPINMTLQYSHQYYVAIQPNLAAGGSVSVLSGWYDSGTTLAAAATASPGWRFEGWNGTGSGSSSSSNGTVSFSAGAGATETAVFYPGLSITAAGSVNVEYQFGSTSGTVPAGSTSEIFVDPTSPLMLTATPTSLLYSFDGWSGASASGASSISLLVGEPQSITASSGYNYIPIVVIAALGGSIAVAWVVRGNRKKPANSPRLVGSQSA
jgi:hypothetical protein